MRQDSPELFINFSGKSTKLLQSMYDYTIVPSEKIKKRMDYFYTPYNQQFLLRKHMTFEDQVPDNAADAGGDTASAADANRRSNQMQSTGLTEIIERMVEEKRKQAETAANQKIDPASQGALD